MKIERLELYHLRLPLLTPFQTSFDRTEATETLIVKVVSEGLIGYGESPASGKPGYSYETVYTARYIIREFLVPFLMRTGITSPGDLSRCFNFVRGHPMAKAGLEMAFWDLKAKQEGIPLYKLYGGIKVKVPAGISIGIQDSIQRLLSMVEDALQKNYHRIKIKIKPGWDISVVEKVRHNQPGIPLMVDANGAYELPDLPHLKALDEYNLMMLEQPLSYDDYVDHRHLARELKTPVCLDEGIRSAQDARRAIELGSCRIINIKQARVGGAAEAIRVHDLCSKRGIPVWCGGLLESGIGRAHNLALAGLPNFTLPGDLSPSSRYYEKDIVEPPISMDKEGWIHLLDKPGIGYDVQERVLKDFCLAYERLVP